MSHKQPFFGPDPLSDPQIDPLRPHLEKFPPAAPRGCLRHCPCGAPAACRQPPKACVLVQYTQNLGPSGRGLIFQSLRRRDGAGTKKKKKDLFLLSAKHKSRLAQHCWFVLVADRAIARVSGRLTCSRARASASDSRRSAQGGEKRRAREARRRAEHGVNSAVRNSAF